MAESLQPSPPARLSQVRTAGVCLAVGIVVIVNIGAITAGAGKGQRRTGDRREGAARRVVIRVHDGLGVMDMVGAAFMAGDY